MALKILHTADWHLGKRFKTFDREDEVKLTRARLDVIDRIFSLAESHRVDAVVCAGDLFDGPAPDETWWRGLLAKIRSRDWSTRPLVLLPGNHDPLTAGSVYQPRHPFRAGLPAGVSVVDRQGWELALGDHAIFVGTPCQSSAGETDIVRSLPLREAGDERIRIGLVHGQTLDIPGHETNFPIDVEAAAERGLDYLAIGDTHNYEVVQQSPVTVVYPGAPEPTAFKETQPGFVALVLFPGPGRPPHVRPERVGRWEWREERCREVSELVRLRDRPNGARSVVRLLLDMTVRLSERDEVERLLTELRGSDASYGRVGALQVDRSRLRLAQEAGLTEFPDDMPRVLQRTVERLQTRVDGEVDPERAKTALFLLWRLVHRREVAP